MAAIGALIWNSTLTLTNAQIIALPTLPQTIVSAPGSGKTIVPILAIWSKVFTIAYTNETGFCAAYIQYSDNTQATSLIEGVTFVTATTNTIVVGSGINVPDQTSTFVGFLGSFAPTVNSALQVAAATDNGQNFGGGNVANSLRVTVWYVMEGP